MRQPHSFSFCSRRQQPQAGFFLIPILPRTAATNVPMPPRGLGGICCICFSLASAFLICSGVASLINLLPHLLV